MTSSPSATQPQAQELLAAGANLAAFFGLHLGTAILSGYPHTKLQRTLDAESKIEALDLLFNAQHSLGEPMLARPVQFIGVRVDSAAKRFVLTIQYLEEYTDVSFSTDMLNWEALYAHILAEYNYSGINTPSLDAFKKATGEVTLKLILPAERND